MKKVYSLFGLVCLFVGAGSAFAVDSGAMWDPTLTQAKSCTQVENVLKEYLNTNRNGGYFGPVQGGVMMNDTATKEAVSVGGIGGGGSEFSATNNQKSGVEESDIIKNDGTYIYYLDAQQNHQVHIVSALMTGKEESVIALPKDVWGSQMFLSNKKLIIIAGKSAPYIAYQNSMIAHDQKVSVMIYDVTNAQAPKLQSAYEYDGYVQESRVIDGKLVLVTSQSFNWGPVYLQRDKMMQSASPESIKASDFTISVRDVLPSWTSLQPTTINYKNGTSKLITTKKTTQVNCANVLYTKPNPAGKNYPQWGQSLTSIVVFSLDNSRTAPSIKTILGNSSQVHVTKNSIFLTAPSYVQTPMRCPINARCMMPMWSQGTYTTIHRFSLPSITYTYSTAMKGTTYSQYSMDATNGFFRIVTSDASAGKNATNVYTIDADGKIAGKLENIAPGEQFQGVRFISDYLYLVTYHQIDPLFVINLTNAAKPAIVAQLKIPGYSTYLHPRGVMQGNIQYLIGLGYDTSVDVNGNERQGGVKIDLYKIDFSQKDAKGNVPVTQVWTKTLGEQGSQTEALSNPRMFMFNDATKELLLPIAIATIQKTQQCNVIYGSNGAEIRKECYPQEMPVTQFAGIKGWKLSTDGISETVSMDYKNILINPYGYPTASSGSIDPWVFTSLIPRVGYVGNTYYFINSQFAHLFSLSNSIGKKIDFTQAPQVIYPPVVTPLKAE